MGRRIAASALGAWAALTLTATPEAATPLSVVEIISGLSAPVFTTSPPGDPHRLLILEQTGKILVYKNGAVLPAPFLDLTSLISTGGERGLLGLAFHPRYDSNGLFYVNYTDTNGATTVARYQVSPNPDVADASSAFTMLTVSQPFANHNAGMLAFSPIDGYLYIGLGDGGSANDPQNNGQKPGTLLGKMIRIDVDGGSPYAVPGDNPWAGVPDTLDEIWAFGLRNPWRYSFDRVTGDLYLADVGQNTLEEVNFQDSGSPGGENYGWRLKEGTNCFNPPTDCDPGGLLTDPIHEYTHGGSPFRCSVTGGYVYRGCAIPDLQGTYFFADYCSGQVWSLRYDGNALTDFQDRTIELGLPAMDISSFGQDDWGELYILAYDLGKVFKIVPGGTASACNCCVDRGNADGLTGAGGPVDVADLTYLVGFLFLGGEAPPCLEEGNADGASGVGGPVDVADLTYLTDFLFLGGPAPPPCSP